MNKKVSEQFKGIKDTYVLQCICTEQNEEIERLSNVLYIIHEILKEKTLNNSFIDLYDTNEILKFLDNQGVRYYD